MNFGYHRTVIQSIPGGFKVSRRNNSVAISQEERPQALVKDEEATRLHVADAVKLLTKISSGAILAVTLETLVLVLTVSARVMERDDTSLSQFWS